MDDSGTYVLCDFGSATPRFLNPQKHSIKDIEEELQRWVMICKIGSLTVLLCMKILHHRIAIMLWFYIAVIAVSVAFLFCDPYVWLMQATITSTVYLLLKLWMNIKCIFITKHLTVAILLLVCMGVPL